MTSAMDYPSGREVFDVELGRPRSHLSLLIDCA